MKKLAQWNDINWNIQWHVCIIIKHWIVLSQFLNFPGDIEIQSILEDHSGIIWAGTINKGLYYL